jgi:hypothetical protein
MLSPDIDEKLFAKKVEAVVGGMCDAPVLLFFEKQRLKVHKVKNGKRER